ncbi:MAG: hypothetical protein IPH07_11720 [Deltaproteobacteria bacterium]|nr:hypothetical protein [Deltaproteobacteria bacterium]MBK8237416.1 hypothetical protein [Deltaproteobacteria bacterium]MBP7285538.1 hypothetical protein [Nannocystaceae bacterium]
MSLISSARAVLLGSGVVVALASCGKDGGGEGQADSSSSGGGSTTSTATTDADESSTSTSGADESSTTAVMTTSPVPECGNGVVEAPEQCDDGNQMAGDGCDVDCTTVVDTTLWSDVIPGAAEVAEAGQGVAVDSQGNVVVVGYIVDALDNPDIWLRKYDPAGVEIWTTVLDPSMGADDRGYGVAIDADDNIGVVGDVGVGQTSSDIFIAKLDPDGGILWTAVVDGPDSQNDIGEDAAFDSEGNLWAVGSVRVDMADTNIWVAKYTSDGTESFSEIVGGPSTLEDRALGVGVDADDNAFVGGYISDEGFKRDVWLRKYDPEGVEAWTVVWDSVEMGADSGFDVAVAPDGSVGVAGQTPVNAVNQDVWLGRFANEDGALVWQKNFGGPAILNDAGLGIAVDSTNAFIVCGLKGLTDTNTDIWIRKWSNEGTTVWTQTFAGDGGNRDVALGVAVDGNDDIAVTGQIRAMDNDNADIWVAKLGGD